MAGHNKWSKVKHIKAREDAKKGKLFSRMSKEISIAARDGGGDPDMNPRLRTAVDNAKSVSMPKDNIERAIKKGTGELGGDALEEITYEGFGPEGVGVMVEVSTDNKNRSAADVRMLFSKNGGNMGTSGCVAYLFQRVGEIRVRREDLGEEELLEKATEAGASDIASDDEHHIVVTAPDQLDAVASGLSEQGLKLRSQELVYVPENTVEIADPSVASKVLKLYEALDDYDDTLNVYANFDIPDAVMRELEES